MNVIDSSGWLEYFICLYLGRNSRDRWRRCVDMHVEYRDRIIGLEGNTARQHFIEHNAKRINIRAMIDLTASRLFGRHVSWCSAYHAGGCLGGRVDDAHQSEVCHDGFNTVR